MRSSSCPSKSGQKEEMKGNIATLRMCSRAAFPFSFLQKKKKKEGRVCQPSVSVCIVQGSRACYQLGTQIPFSDSDIEHHWLTTQRTQSKYGKRWVMNAKSRRQCQDCPYYSQAVPSRSARP
jgi:hypothetical protein